MEELKRARHMVANHHSIVSNLQETYGEQIRTIYADHQKSLDVAKAEKNELEDKIQILLQGKQEIK